MYACLQQNTHKSVHKLRKCDGINGCFPDLSLGLVSQVFKYIHVTLSEWYACVKGGQGRVSRAVVGQEPGTLAELAVAPAVPAEPVGGLKSDPVALISLNSSPVRCVFRDQVGLNVHGLITVPRGRVNFSCDNSSLGLNRLLLRLSRR